MQRPGIEEIDSPLFQKIFATVAGIAKKTAAHGRCLLFYSMSAGDYAGVSANFVDIAGKGSSGTDTLPSIRNLLSGADRAARPECGAKQPLLLDLPGSALQPTERESPRGGGGLPSGDPQSAGLAGGRNHLNGDKAGSSEPAP